MRVLFFLVSLVALTPSALAGDCSAQLRSHVAGYLAIVRGMADFKAGMDASYAACMVNYPEKFAPLRPVNDFMQANMEREMEQARAVLDHLIDHPGVKAVATSCAADETAKDAVRADVTDLLGGQYSKAYARRHRAMSRTDLVGEDQDSCLIILEMVQKYEEYYGRFDQVRNVLYEAAKKQGRKSMSRADRKSFGQFEKARKRLFSDQ